MKTKISSVKAVQLELQFPEFERQNLEDKIYRQFTKLKQKHPDAVLLFRSHDIYISYNEDALFVANTAGVEVIRTPRKATRQEARFPCTFLDVALPKLIRAGKRVAICDEL